MLFGGIILAMDIILSPYAHIVSSIFFGEIIDAKVKLSSIGESAKKCWIEIPFHFPFVKLGEFIIMPNHVHGIIIIDKPENRQSKNRQNKLPIQFNSNRFGPQSKNLASIVRGYKTGVTINARKVNPRFKWQERYYDHIILQKSELYSISKYIRNNPLKWNRDEFFDYNLIHEEE